MRFRERLGSLKHARGIVLDRRGRIAWGRSEIDGDPIVSVLAQNVSNAGLAGLRGDRVSTEKIFYLSRKLTTQGTPEGYEPRAGDIAYYAPWGNIAIFHEDFRYSPGLVKLGTIDPTRECSCAADR